MEGTFGNQSLGVLSFRGFDQTTGNTFDDQAYGYEHALQDGTFLYWSDGVLAHHSIAGDDSTIETGMEARNLHTGLVWFSDHAFEYGCWVPQGHADLTDVFVDEHKPNYEINAGYLDISPNYDPIDGFTANSDIRGLQGFVNLVGSSAGMQELYAVRRRRPVRRPVAVRCIKPTRKYFSTRRSRTAFRSTASARPSASCDATRFRQAPAAAGRSFRNQSSPAIPAISAAPRKPSTSVRFRSATATARRRPIDVNYSWGPFGSNYIHLFTVTTSRPLDERLSLGLEYDGTYERRSPAATARLPMAAPHFDQLQSHAATARLRSACATSTAWAALRRRPETISPLRSTTAFKRKRAVHRLRLSGGEHDAEPADREIVFHAGADEGT